MRLIYFEIVSAVIFFSILSLSSALIVDSVIMDSKSLVPGESRDIEIGLKNNGDNDIEDVSVSIDLSEIPIAPFDSSSEFEIGKINEGKTKYAQFKIYATTDAKSQVYKIPLKITYIEDDVVKSKESLISVSVNSIPEIETNLEENLLLKGEKNDISIKIINKGLSDIKFLEVELDKSPKFDIISTDKVYVGDINSDDFDNIKFTVFLKQNIPDSFELPVKLKYKDSLNNPFEKNVTLKIKVYSREKAVELGLIKKNYYFQIVLVIISLILIFILYRTWKKKKRNSKIEKEF